jgi:uncharacterized protein involved in outer membrane biogenesis
MVKPRKVLRWSLTGVGALLVVLVALPLLAALIGITISAAPWRASIAQAATDALGRAVTLEGPLELHLSLRPWLRVGGIRIANPPGFGAPDFASLGAAKLRLELRPLLRYQLRVMEVSADDVRVRLEKLPDGRANWQFALAPSAHAPDQPTPSAGGTRKVKLEAISRVAFQHINLEYVANGTSRYFALDEAIGEGAYGSPVALTLRGSVEKTFPYTLAINGGTLSALYASDQAWPLDIHLDFVGTELQVTGSIKGALTNPTVDVLFGLGTENLAELERLLQAKFPPVGATALSARIEWGGQRLRVSNLRGVMGASELEGDLAFDLTSAKPRLSGELRMPVLDLTPFLVAQPKPAAVPAPGHDLAHSAADAQKAMAQLDKQSYSFKELGLMDADLTLQVGRWIGVPGDVRDSQLGIAIRNGQLKAPMQATVADVRLAGEVDVDTTAQVPDLVLWLGTERSKLGRLAEVFARVRGVEGDVGRLKLQLKGRGDHLSAIVSTLDVRVDLSGARLSYGNVEGGRPVELKLNEFHLALPAGGKLNGSAQGSLVREVFSARLSGGDLPTLMREVRWPLELELKTGSAALQVSGVLAPPEAEHGTDLQFRLAATRAGDVAEWLGLARAANVAVAIEGHVRVESDEWRLSPFTFRLGRTAMSAELARVGIGTKPLVQATLAVDNVDTQELEGLLPPPDPKAPKKSIIDLPILPKGIDLFDADVDVKVRRIDVQPVPVSAISFNGHIRDGHMFPSPFGATVAGVTFSGAIGVDLRSDVPEVSVWVAAEKVNVGALLKQLKLVQAMDAGVELLRAEMVMRGSRVGEMLGRSSVIVEMEAGQLTLRDPNQTLQLPIQVANGIVRVSPGKPLAADLDGTIDVTPVAIRLSGAELPDLLKTGSRVPFGLTFEAASTRLELNGKVKLPVTQGEFDLDLTVKGERFDTLDRLLRVQLPHWGPWGAGGRFRVSKSGYQVDDLALHVGQSTLNGRGSLVTAGVRPRIDMELTAPRVQLDDFKLDGWSLVEKKEKKSEKPLSMEEMRAKAREAAAQGQKLLSREVLRQLDATLNIDVGEVLSGHDRLGSGALHAQLADGKFVLDPAEVNTAGGSAHMTFTYEPTETDVAVQATIRTERFDYGILARRIKPDTDLQGLLSLHMEINSRAPTLDALMQHADGRIDFAVWPKNFKSGIFDLWAVNLLAALVPAVDPAKESVVNCAIARFDLRDGTLTQDKILMDTSRMRVSGQGMVNFNTEALAFRLVPTAKSPQFFSLATPVGVTGTITDFKIGVSGSDVAETFARLFTSVIVVPIESLFGRKLPRDGADVCANATREVRR